MSKEPQRLLIFPGAGIGEVVSALGVAALIKHLFPAAQVVMAAYHDDQMSLLCSSSSVDEVVALQLRNIAAGGDDASRYSLSLQMVDEEFDRYIFSFEQRQIEVVGLDGVAGDSFVYLLNEGDGHLSGFGRFVKLQERLCDYLAVGHSYRLPVITHAKAHQFVVDSYLAPLEVGRFAVVSLSAREPLKSLPRRYIDYLQPLCAARGLDLILVGATMFDPLPEGLKGYFQSESLVDVAELIRRAELFLGPDSLLLQLAVAVGTNSIAVIGPTAQSFTLRTAAMVTLDKSSHCPYRPGYNCIHCLHPDRIAEHPGGECLYWNRPEDIEAALRAFEPVATGSNF